MIDIEELEKRKDYIMSGIRGLTSRRHIKTDFHNLKMSRIEAVLSRGDRGIGKVVFLAWQKGARLQSWNDHFDHDIWDKCFEESAIQSSDYLKASNADEMLPWSFIRSV
jgi:hypothetical protein